MEINHNQIARTAALKSEINSDSEADHLSNLPDNIITEIFSYLTMKEALAICISCKKLMHLWTTIPHLEFKESADDEFNLLVDTKKRNLIQVIDRFVKNRSYPVQTFRLLFYPGWYSDDVFSWIGAVVQKGLIELDLNFLSNLGVPIQLPSSLLNSKTLQVLKLRSCVLESPVGLTYLGSLKSVFLTDVILSDDMINTLISQSGLLQSLELVNCIGFHCIKVTDTNAKLDYLSLENCCELTYLFAPRVRALSICTKDICVFVIETSQVPSLLFVHKSSIMLSQRQALLRTSKLLEAMKFSADEVEHVMNFEYQGVAMSELETYSGNILGLHGHTWLLRSGYFDKVVISTSLVYHIIPWVGPQVKL